MKKRWFFRACVLGVGLLACYALFPFVKMVVFVLLSVASVRVTEYKMRQPGVYEPLGRAMALYCQSEQDWLPRILHAEWYPAEIDAIGNPRGEISPTQASLEMGGGFYHFGYSLRLDEAASTDKITVWQLFMYSESSAERHLTTIQLPSSDNLSPVEMLARAVAGYDRRLASEPDAEGAWEGKALLLRRFSKTSEAIAVCNDWIDRQPAYWRPRFLTAHLRSRVGEVDDAGADFSKWVEANQNFPHFIYLFLFSMREGKHDAALTAIGRALQQPFLEPPKCSGNKFYLGHNAAVFAFAQEDYALCIAMCDKMLADDRREVYWRQKILVLKAAAHIMLGEEQPAREAVSAIPNPARFGTTTNDASRHRQFLEAIKCADTDFLRDYTNWKNEGLDWFSPVDMYDSLLYRSDGIPLLYREDWRDCVGF